MWCSALHTCVSRLQSASPISLHLTSTNTMHLLNLLILDLLPRVLLSSTALPLVIWKGQASLYLVHCCTDDIQCPAVLLCGTCPKHSPVQWMPLCFFLPISLQLYGKHFLEIISFLIVNVLTMMYAAFEGKYWKYNLISSGQQNSAWH